MLQSHGQEVNVCSLLPCGSDSPFAKWKLTYGQTIRGTTLCVTKIYKMVRNGITKWAA